MTLQASLPGAHLWWDASARFDENQIYRYELRRTWGRINEPHVIFIMLNPSKAGAHDNTAKDGLDTTVRRCVGYARDWNYSGIEVANLFALMSTNPEGLAAVRDPVGPENDRAIYTRVRAVVGAGGIAICAWGAHPMVTQTGREAEVLELLRGVPLHYLKLTESGHPSHPLYLPARLRPTPMEIRHAA